MWDIELWLSHLAGGVPSSPVVRMAVQGEVFMASGPFCTVLTCNRGNSDRACMSAHLAGIQGVAQSGAINNRSLQTCLGT